ncbi:hypothetical protein [Chitinophaga sp. Cy-1792]|uniref:DUF7691 family protein n=1 Tax=Chitinophaga sp. Cy-1792 TaxID=2608339 RepID=UPI001423FE9A|nr:hypothetical protein [Chitinophaga sp. Cy-1792]NIG52404.1 hypothetical protein [Chitinophaga sp. Cy-1792]
MGSYLFSYAVNYERLKSACGSKEETLILEIQKSPRFERYSRKELPVLNMQQALKQIIDGYQPKDWEAAASFWYAFIAMADYFGERLQFNHEIKLHYETDLIDRYLKEDFQVEFNSLRTLLNGKLSNDLPPGSQDGIYNGVLKEDELLNLRNKLEHISITDERLKELEDEDFEKEMAYDCIRQLQKHVNYCLANNLSLVVFAH